MHIGLFTFCRHALQRALDMGIDGDELRQCLEQPWRVCDSSRGDGRQLYFGDRITCVVSDVGEVITVLWRTAEGWASDLADGGYGDRHLREEPY